MTKKLIIFDFDGVIYDSESLHLKGFNHALIPLKKEISRDIYYKDYCSFDDNGVFTSLLKNEGVDFDKNLIDKLIEEKHKYFDSNHEEQTRIYPGVLDLIYKLSKKYILAIGSGARRDEILRILKKENIANHFEVIISANETSYPKPNPETYIKVLEDVNNSEQINPEEVVVIEDTPKGVTAAKLAQMKTIGITNAVESSRLSEADKIVSDYLEINEELIDSL